jgi:tetratricopeptide (TPR) repeat protein
MGNYELALPYALDAIRSAKTTDDTTYLVLFYHRVGHIYQVLNQHAQALDIYKTLINKLLREPSNGHFRVRLLYIRKISQSLMALKRPQESLTFIKNFLGSYTPNEFWEEALAAICLGEAYMGLKDYSGAEKHLKEGLVKAMSEKTSEYSLVSMNNSIVRQFHANLTNLYLVTGQLQKASFHLKENFSISNTKPCRIPCSMSARATS